MRSFSGLGAARAWAPGRPPPDFTGVAGVVAVRHGSGGRAGQQILDLFDKDMNQQQVALLDGLETVGRDRQNVRAPFVERTGAPPQETDGHHPEVPGDVEGRTRFTDVPLVESTTSTSSARPSASTCRAKIRSNP